MTWFIPGHYVYVIFSLRGLYIGKGSGERVHESMKERHGLFYFILGRHYTQKGAYRVESKLIRFCRSTGIPLQNGRAPRRGLWATLFPRCRRRRKTSTKDLLIAVVFWAVVIWWLIH